MFPLGCEILRRPMLQHIYVGRKMFINCITYLTQLYFMYYTSKELLQLNVRKMDENFVYTWSFTFLSANIITSEWVFNHIISGSILNFRKSANNRSKMEKSDRKSVTYSKVTEKPAHHLSTTSLLLPLHLRVWMLFLRQTEDGGKRKRMATFCVSISLYGLPTY